MVACDLPTQEKYEGQISTLQRQINTLSDQLRIANQTIHQGQDDEEETPTPMLHMMNRIEEAEGKCLALRNQVIACCVDDTDYEAIAQMAYEQHQTTCPSEAATKSKYDIQQEIVDDVARSEELCDQDYLADEIDNAVEDVKSEYDDAVADEIALKEEAEEELLKLIGSIQVEREANHMTRVECQFNLWRDQQCQWNSQYSIDDEVGFLFEHFPEKDYPRCKQIFDTLYAEQGHKLLIALKDWHDGADDPTDDEDDQ
tara:strand:- start:1894 stop:2664 length:771 start_codon:yes stop_codon:yes gene_type:complete